MTTPLKCRNIRERSIAFVSGMDKSMSASEICKSVGGRGVTPNRVHGYLRGYDGVEYIPGKRVKTGPNAGKCDGAGKWRRKPVEMSQIDAAEVV
jgi:hypothetical protein